MSDDGDIEELVGRSIGSLTRRGHAAPWRAPNELRRVARRRQRRRLVVLGAAGLAMATALTLAVALPGSGGGPGRPSPPVAATLRTAAHSGAGVQLVANVSPLSAASGNVEENAVAKAEQEFTFALLRQVNTSGTDANVVLSPASLAIALAMLQNGAGGTTRSEIAHVLGTSGLSNQQQDAGWTALMADLSAGRVLDSANSLWLQQGTPMVQTFMDAMARYFRTGVWQVDFANDLGGATKAINAWVAQQTHGKITKLFNDGDIDPSTLLVLANAVYFKAAWQTEFDPKQTQDAPFTKADGSTVSVPFMNTGEAEPTLVANGDDVQAVQLPYTGGRFAALALMPTKQSLTDYVHRLTPASLDTITGQLRAQSIPVRIPKFTISQYTRLNDTLKAMGMPTAFSPTADLSPLSPVGGSVQSVVQRDFLKVDEHGTEAAAVTGISVIPQSTRSVAAFDHPFLFLVRDTTSGAIVFSAQIQDPAA